MKDLKTCSTCKRLLPRDHEHFNRRKASPDGLSYSCKDCQRKAAAASYQKRKEKKHAQLRYLENRDKIIERSKKRYEENREEILEYQREWRQTSKGKKAISKAGKKRRELIAKQTPGGRDYTRQEVIERDSVFGECVCQICGKPIDLESGELQIDHIIPISAGGSDTLDNVRCTHRWCNATRPKDGSDENVR